jgi:hypothetical protein
VNRLVSDTRDSKSEMRQREMEGRGEHGEILHSSAGWRKRRYSMERSTESSMESASQPSSRTSARSFYNFVVLVVTFGSCMDRRMVRQCCATRWEIKQNLRSLALSGNEQLITQALPRVARETMAMMSSKTSAKTIVKSVVGRFKEKKCNGTVWRSVLAWKRSWL